MRFVPCVAGGALLLGTLATPVQARCSHPLALAMLQDTRPDVTPFASPTNVPAAGSPIAKKLDDLRASYRTARRLFGGDHVLLTAMAFYQCDDRVDGGQGTTVSTGGGLACKANIVDGAGAVSYERAAHGGAAGVVMVPLLGFGGGHNRKWWQLKGDMWPVLKTDDELQAFLEFQRQLKLHRNLAGADLTVSGNMAEAVSFRLGFEEILRREVQTGSDIEAIGEAFLECLQDLDDARISASANPTASETQIAQMVTTLWDEFQAIKGESTTERHNVLIGPFLGIPITEDPRDRMLYGLGIELAPLAGVFKGWSDLRFTAAVGWSADYTDRLELKSGWALALGLSGSFGDDLVHFFNGASAAGHQVSVRSER